MKTESRPSYVTAGIALAIAAAMSFATTGFIASQLVKTTPGIVVAFLEALWGLALVTLVNARALTTVRGFTRGAVPWIVLAGLTLGGGAAFYYTALNYVPFSVASPIVGAVPLVSYGFILLLLRGHERITPRVLLGAVMVVTGVIVIRIVNA